jgi:arylsulfatase A-like enzyme
MGKSVRTDEWRYTEWGDGDFGRELYDHINDPGEFYNLADKPGHESTMKQLKESYFEKMPKLLH